MDWTDRLNQMPRWLELGHGRLELLGWNFASHLPDNAAHRHTFFEICQVGAYGQGHFIVEGQPYRLAPHDLFIARPGVTHQIINTARPNMELYWVSFSWIQPHHPHHMPHHVPDHVPDHEVDALLEGFANAPVVVVADDGEQVASLWRALRAVAGGDLRTGTKIQLEALTLSLLLAIAQAGSAASGIQTEEVLPGRERSVVKVQLATRYIHDNLDRRLSVSELSAQLNLSPRQVARLFRRHLGVSPASYIERVRLERAQTLLQNSPTPIKKIAAAVGYSSVHHFSRVFSRRLGLSPGVFRDCHVAKSQRGGE